ncbi:hypothetical protein TNCV_3273281 [Trichonephila clavipes]|nr:hypothetical protein TNCV_3273281 [Trichonephila clavipes]
MVRRKRTAALTLIRCLGIGSTVTRVSHVCPKLLVFWVTAVYLSMYVDIMNALCSSEGQEDVRLRLLDSLLGSLLCSLIAGDFNTT